MDEAKTPNFDHLCGESETGMLKKMRRSEDSFRGFGSLDGFSVLEIHGVGRRPMLDGVPGTVDREATDNLLDVERMLDVRWGDYDFFVLRLNADSMASEISGGLDPAEWVEMLDAWLPGLIAYFHPDVVGLSGDIWLDSEADFDSDGTVPVLLRNDGIRAIRGGEGFTLDCCRSGGLGSKLSVRDWLVLLKGSDTRSKKSDKRFERK